MSCQICDLQLVNCLKCNFTSCYDCNDMIFCKLENGYICQFCSILNNIRILTCIECNITSCSDCKTFFNCYNLKLLQAKLFKLLTTLFLFISISYICG